MRRKKTPGDAAGALAIFPHRLAGDHDASQLFPIDRFACTLIGGVVEEQQIGKVLAIDAAAARLLLQSVRDAPGLLRRILVRSRQVVPAVDSALISGKPN